MKMTFRLWLLVVLMIFSCVAVFGIPPAFLQKGVAIESVGLDSSAVEVGLQSGMVVTAIDGREVTSAIEAQDLLSEKFPSENSQKTVVETTEGRFTLFTNETPQIAFGDLRKTYLQTGLDLSGGARALVKAQNQSLSTAQVNELVEVIRNRFNVYGLSDINVVPVTDLSGESFVLIEIAGATPKDLQTLIAEQGKFEARIGNETAFIGGERDITSVCRNDARCAGIQSCSQGTDGAYFCNFQFTLYLSSAAAERHADITGDLAVVPYASGRYLSENLSLYLDDVLVDELLIGESLRGRVTSEIAISGSGTAATEADAYDAAVEEMHALQTVLVTGSLPYKLEVVKLDTISPELGQEFIRLLILAGLASLLAVSIFVFIRYRDFKSALALVAISLSEVVLILGIAAFIRWNLDLPSIAGILATIGTGIDQQIILLDESQRNRHLTVIERLKRAFGIIVGAYFTALVALLPLMWAGAGLLKGFAITTIIGISVGVLITRPAFSDLLKNAED